MKHGLVRVTLDLDDADELDVLRGVHCLRADGAESVDIRVSSGGEGFHVRAWFDGLSDEGVERLRRMYGDHVRRIDLDATHQIKPDQMLFTRKPNGAEAGPWRNDVEQAIEDFTRRSTRRGFERLKGEL